MPKGNGFERRFPLLAAVLLLAEMLSPMAYASQIEATGAGQGSAIPLVQYDGYLTNQFDSTLSTLSLQSSGSAIAGCELKEVTPAQYKRLMDSVYQFAGKEITDRPDTSLKALPPANAQNINVNVYNFPVEESSQFMTAKEFAQLASAPAGKSVSDVLKDVETDLGVGPDEQISIAQARALAAKKSYSNSLQGVFNSLVSKNKAAKAGEPTAPGFEAMKVRLPTGVELPLSELMKTPAIKNRLTGGESCLLNDASITGKLSYRAMLDKDLTIAGDRAEVAKSAEAQDNQHINSDGFKGSFQSYDGNVVIPRMVEKAVTEMKSWSKLDFMLTSAFSLYALGSAVKATKAAERAVEKVKLNTDFQISHLQPEVRTAILSPYGRATEDAFEKALLSKSGKMELPYQFNPGAAGGFGLSSVEAQEFTDLGSKELQMTYLYNKRTTLFPADTIDQIQLQAKSLGPQRRITELTEEIDLAKTASSLSASRAWSSAALGLLWLGPARFGLEFSSSIFFASIGSPEKSLGSRLVIFINNNAFSQAFREGSDFLLSGHIYDLISDVTKSGIPRKTFSSGSVQLIQAMDDNGKQKLSRTAFTQGEAGWLIGQAWVDQSSATLFEDVKDGRPISSMAISINYTKLGATLNRRQEFQQYYDAIGVLAPLFGWFAVRNYVEAPAGLVALLRLQIFDIYIDNFVDPLKFSDNEKCNDENLQQYLLKYKATVAVGVAENFVIISAPYLKSLELIKVLMKNTAAEVAINSYSRLGVVDPVGLLKAHYGSLALQYASTCKDSQYKIMAFQRLPDKVPVSVLKKVQEKTASAVGLGDVVKGLNIGKSLETFIGSQLKAQDLKEILNLKVLMQNQNGQVRPSDLYEVHIEPLAQMQKTALYGSEAGCFRNCLVDSSNKFVCLDDKRGVYDANGTIIPDKDFALNSYLIPKLGNVIPSRIIVSPLTCGSGVFAEARASDASVTLVDALCSTTDCLKSRLAEVTGYSGYNALSHPNWFGQLQSIQSTLGLASVHQGEFKFIYTKGVQVKRTTTGGIVERLPFVGEGVIGNLPGVADTPKNAIQERTGATQSSLNSKELSLTGTEKRLGEIEITGDGKVRVKGASTPEDELGTLLTMEFTNGQINYDSEGKRLVAVIQTLADIPASSIQTLGAQPAVSESPKQALQQEKSEMDALKAALNANQKLSDKQTELLKQMLDKIASGKNAFNDAELAQLRAAMQKLAQGQPLTPLEAALLSKAQQQPIFPGVVVIPPEKVAGIGNALQQGGATQAQTDALKAKLASQTPLTLADKAIASNAIDSAQKSGKISASQASDLKNAVDGATAPSERAKELSTAIASGSTLTAQQQALKAQLLAQAALEQTRLASEIAAAPSVDIPGVKLGPVVGKPGQEDNARKLNTALNKLGTLTDFKTENHAISFGSDSNGNAVVRIGNKETGAVDTLKITGPAVRDGNAIVFPTDKGPLKFEFNMNPATGAPTINIAGPNIRENSPLLLAQGKDGFIWFDPTTGTWKSGPGIVIPTDGLFGKTGAQFQGSADGTRGFAGQDKFTPPNTALEPSVNFQSGNPLSLPSWPDNAFAIIAMIMAVLAGALITRVVSSRKDE